jgi:type I restriction enzyme, S subunit
MKTVGDVALTNPESLTAKISFDEYLYLDTTNLTDNELFQFERYNDKKELPSRAKRRVRPNDILISTVRPNQRHFGILVDPPKNLVVSTGFTVVRVVDESVDPFYLYYLLTEHKRMRRLEMIGNTSVSSYPSIRPDDIEHLPIELPEKREQERIGKGLYAIDRKMAVNKSLVEELNKQMELLFIKWFHLGQLPDMEEGLVFDWEEATLTDIADYENGLAMQRYRPKSEAFLPIVKIRELKQGYVDDESEHCDVNIKDSVKLYDGDVIFSWSASLFVDVWCGGEAGLNQHLFKVTSDDYPKWFYYLWTKHHLQRFINIALSKKTTMGHVNRKHLEQAIVKIPSREQIDAMNKQIEPLFNRIVTLKQETLKLKKLKHLYIKKIM